MKLTKEQFLEKIKPIIGDSTDDNILSLLEDINDTFNSSDNEDYKTKYEDEVKGRAEDNKNWAIKYRDTFFNPKAKEEFENINKEKDEENDEDEKPLTFEMLFNREE